MTTSSLPEHPTLAGARILAGPTRRGNELRWELELADGQPAVLARLVDELSADASVRRRYRRDLDRLDRLAPAGVARLLAWGPQTEREDAPPWRLREAPAGSSIQTWLERRAPAPPDELSELLARICELLAPLHASGFVVRDLNPSKIVERDDGDLTLVDVGLARTDILSTRTAASLVLEGSPYTAPELMARTAVDGRADLYALGVLGFRGLTGQLPFGDTHALLRPAGDAPPPSSIHRGAPQTLDALIVALLAAEPDARPASASFVAEILRGEAVLPGRALARLRCQNCGAPMPVAQRLCLGCGKLAVQYQHIDAGAQAEGEQAYEVVLRKAKEDEVFMSSLRQLCAELCEGQVPRLNFVIGDARMYSEAERKRSLQLPVTLFTDLDHGTATALSERFAERGIEVKIEAAKAPEAQPGALTPRQKRVMAMVPAIVVAAGIAGAAISGIIIALGIACVVALVVAGIMYAAFRKTNGQRLTQWGRSLMRLRPAPAALPASDPLVARLAAVLRSPGELAPDIHAFVSRLALQVQRVVDHRIHNAGAGAEIDLALSALEPLVAHVEARVDELVEIDRSLAALDEGHLVRALAAAEARDEGPEAKAGYLDGLDRLRELEIERARALDGLARACDLARRSVDMGLRVRDPEAEHERRIAMALAALDY